VSAPQGFLLDTNIVSETRRRRPDPGVVHFLEAADPAALFLSVLSLGELRKGIARKNLEDPVAAEQLATWVDGLESGFADRLLGVDAAVARLWGEWSADRPRPVPVPIIDTLLAATAGRYGLTLVTRNAKDVAGIPVPVLNPWTQRL
jgi:predicted nucleic acid-binding protein